MVFQRWPWRSVFSWPSITSSYLRLIIPKLGWSTRRCHQPLNQGISQGGEPPKIESHGRPAGRATCSGGSNACNTKGESESIRFASSESGSQAKTQAGLSDERPVAIKQTPAIQKERQRFTLKPPAPMTEPMPKTVKKADTPSKASEDVLAGPRCADQGNPGKKSPDVDPNLIISGSKIIFPPGSRSAKRVND